MKLQLEIDKLTGETFKEIARSNNITQGKLFSFLLDQFLGSGTPQTRAGKLSKIEKKL